MHDNERELIQRWRNGDKKAFGALVRIYMTDAYLIALGFTGNSEDARDLSQDAFIKAFQARAQFDPERPFYPWFYRILRNRCLNFIRRESRKCEPLYYDDKPDRERFPSRTSTPLEDLEKEERVRMLHAAIERLSFEHREVIVLKNFKGCSYEQIAKTLDIPIGTVMSRLYYARKMLRKILIEIEQHGLDEIPELVPEARTAPGEVV
ncbi:MAG: sigma-70 family RNA polymerase sigma factor [Candidatus Latescibacterota bacterium]|nr:MAG: sigma-70 family RNA polymerase sigma factor [Candidatus Latescibacterota bacterium]